MTRRWLRFVVPKSVMLPSLSNMLWLLSSACHVQAVKVLLCPHLDSWNGCVLGRPIRMLLQQEALEATELSVPKVSDVDLQLISLSCTQVTWSIQCNEIDNARSASLQAN